MSELALTGYYAVPAWIAYVTAGLAVGRLDLDSPRVACQLLLGGAGLAVCALEHLVALSRRAAERAAAPAAVLDPRRTGVARRQGWCRAGVRRLGALALACGP